MTDMKEDSVHEDLREEVGKKLIELATLKNASVATVEQMKKQYPDFARKADDLCKMGNSIFNFLESKQKEAGNDAQVLLTLATLAKCCLTVNIKLYAHTIGSAVENIAQIPEVKLLALREITGPWDGIKEFLYSTKHNDAREIFREGLLSNMPKGSESPIVTGELDHLERFLEDPDGRAPHEFIPEYVERYQSELMKWLGLNIDDFEKYIADQLDDKSVRYREEFLVTLDEQIASIKPEHVQEALGKSAKYQDRTKKLTLVRDLRFARDNPRAVKRRTLDRIYDVSSNDSLKEIRAEFASRLRKHVPELIQVLQNSQSMATGERVKFVQETIGEFEIDDATRTELTNKITTAIVNKEQMVQEALNEPRIIEGTLMISYHILFDFRLKVKDGKALAVVDEKGREREDRISNDSVQIYEDDFEKIEDYFLSKGLMFDGRPQETEVEGDYAEDYPGYMYMSAYSLNEAIKEGRIVIDFDGDSFHIEEMES